MVNTLKIREHMEIIGSCGNRVGSVNRLEGNFIKVTQNDLVTGDRDHFIPLEWIESVGQDVRLSKSCDQVRLYWQPGPERQTEKAGVDG
jgi:hypothetical protein